MENIETTKTLSQKVLEWIEFKKQYPSFDARYGFGIFMESERLSYVEGNILHWMIKGFENEHKYVSEYSLTLFKEAIKAIENNRGIA